MTRVNRNEPQKQNLSPQSGTWWLRPLLLGIIGFSLLLLLVPNAWLRPPANEPGDVVARRALEGAKAPAPVSPRRTLAPDQRTSTFMPWQQSPGPMPRDIWTRRAQSPPPPPEPVQHV